MDPEPEEDESAMFYQQKKRGSEGSLADKLIIHQGDDQEDLTIILSEQQPMHDDDPHQNYDLEKCPPKMITYQVRREPLSTDFSPFAGMVGRSHLNSEEIAGFNFPYVRAPGEVSVWQECETYLDVYGLLAVLAYSNLQLSPHESTPTPLPNSPFCLRFNLERRPNPNGFIEEASAQSNPPLVVPQSSIQSCLAFEHTEQSRIGMFSSIKMSYDPRYDIFQVGRDLKNDLVIQGVETVSPYRGPSQFGVSQYAFYILVEREPPHEARIFAGGFDTMSNSIKFTHNQSQRYRVEECDGFTSCGLLIKKPGTSTWREISVRGRVFQMRSRGIPEWKHVWEEDNRLEDNTLIDICGVTLIWRSGYSSSTKQSPELLLEFIKKLSKSSCPVVFEPFSTDNVYANLTCGHVISELAVANSTGNCAICRAKEKYVKLRFDVNAGLDWAMPDSFFIPCGHVIAQSSARAWMDNAIPLELPFDRSSRPLVKVCPFCRGVLEAPFLQKLYFEY